MGNKKRREDDWVFFTCFQADGIDERFTKSCGRKETIR
jgi:hypothetical protein